VKAPGAHSFGPMQKTPLPLNLPHEKWIRIESAGGNNRFHRLF
jgi:hypothetical protein